MQRLLGRSVIFEFAALALLAVGCSEIKEIGTEAVEQVLEEQKVNLSNELRDRGRAVADEQREKIWEQVDEATGEDEKKKPAGDSAPAGDSLPPARPASDDPADKAE